MSKASNTAIDPVCLFHGKRWSEHEYGRCLYCCLCFNILTLDECATTVDGDKTDVCEECYAMELAGGL